MMNLKTVFIVLLIYWLPAPSFALQAEVFPPEISPGDVFLVRVCAPALPEGAVVGGLLTGFNPEGEGCYIAIGAMGLDTKPGDYEVSVKSAGEKAVSLLVVRKVSFPEISLTLPPEKVFLSIEDQKRAVREQERLSLIWKEVSGRLWKGGFIQPVESDVLTLFGVKRIINKEKVSIHWGIDIGCEEGAPVRAANSGRAVFEELLFFGGNTLIIDHGMGVYTIYMHLSGFNVKVGAPVERGDIVGFVGSTGRVTGPHLHFGVKVGGLSVNPLSLIGLVLK